MRKFVCPFPEIRACVHEGSSVFEIGCGTGAILSDLIRTRAVRKVGGCETSAVALERARESINRAFGSSVESSDFLITKKPPTCLKSYDSVILIDVLHHIPLEDQPVFLQQLAQQMRPGAKFILKDINAERRLVFCNRFHDLLFSGDGFQEISLPRAIQLVCSSGFKILNSFEIWRLWYPHYFVIAEKTYP